MSFLKTSISLSMLKKDKKTPHNNVKPQLLRIRLRSATAKGPLKRPFLISTIPHSLAHIAWP